MISLRNAADEKASAHLENAMLLLRGRCDTDSTVNVFKD